MIWNFRQLAHHALDGFGGIGEGMSMQLAKDGRRILWLAHESAPKNFTAVDVSDPHTPKIVARADLPHNHMRSNSLETVGDILAVAYQTQQPGDAAGRVRAVRHLDPGKPEADHLLRLLRAEFARRASAVVRRRRIHPHELGRARLPADPPEGRPVLPVHRREATRRSRSRSAAGGCPARGRATTRRRRSATPEASTPASARTTPTSIRERPDRVYMGYIDGGMIILDIADKAHPKMVSRWDYHPPYPGFTHTVVPLFERDLLIVSDECTRNDGADWPKLVWIVDDRTEDNPVPIATCPLPPVEAFARRGGRYGAHNLWENLPKEGCWKSDTHRPRHLLQRRAAGLRHVEPVPAEGGRAISCRRSTSAPTGACQINDVFVDDRGIVFTVDRHVGGLYALEMDF